MDTYLRTLNAVGTEIAQGDDTTNSLLAFIPVTTGNYYLAAGSYQDSSLGDYQLTISNSTADIAFCSAHTSGAYADLDLIGHTITHSTVNIYYTWDEMTMGG